MRANGILGTFAGTGGTIRAARESDCTGETKWEAIFPGFLLSLLHPTREGRGRLLPFPSLLHLSEIGIHSVLLYCFCFCGGDGDGDGNRGWGDDGAR